jgi:hypothetical protein
VPRQARLPRRINPPPLCEAGVGKHPHLSSEQHEERRRTALHEAAHFVTGIHLGAGCWSAYIRVPGRSPRMSSRGRDGWVQISGISEEDDAVVNIAAIFVEVTFNPKSWDTRAARDIYDFDRWADKRQLSREYVFNLCDRALRIVVDHWPAIDGVAAAFLEFGYRDGIVPVRNCLRIADWVRSGLWRSRWPEHPPPARFAARLAGIGSSTESA